MKSTGAHPALARWPVHRLTLYRFTLWTLFLRSVLSVNSVLSVIEGTQLLYSLQPYPALSPIMHLFPPNILVSGHEHIPGVLPATDNTGKLTHNASSLSVIKSDHVYILLVSGSFHWERWFPPTIQQYEGDEFETENCPFLSINVCSRYICRQDDSKPSSRSFCWENLLTFPLAIKGCVFVYLLSSASGAWNSSSYALLSGILSSPLLVYECETLIIPHSDSSTSFLYALIHHRREMVRLHSHGKVVCVLYVIQVQQGQQCCGDFIGLTSLLALGEEKVLVLKYKASSFYGWENLHYYGKD